MNKKLIEQLYNSRLLRTREELEEFEESLKEISKEIQENDIPELCKVFDDQTENEEVMFGLIHFIENFPDKEYLYYIGMCSPNMKDGYEWAMILNKRILNNEKSLKMYPEVISNMKNDYKRKILELLINIKNENPIRFGKKVDYVIENVK